MTNSLLKLSQLLISERNNKSVVAVNGNKRYLWCDFITAVTGLTLELKSHPEQRWLLCCDDAYQFAVGFMALLHSAKTIILPPNSQPGTLLELAVNADAMVSGRSLVNLKLPIVTLEINLDSNTEQWVSVKNQNKVSHFTAEQLAPDLIIEVLTSGSEGTNKSIVKKLQHFDAEIQGLECLWGPLLADSLIFSTVSHQHIYGLLFRVLWPLCAGRTFVSHNHQYPESLFADMESAHSSSIVLISSPAHLKRIPAAIDLTALRKTVAAVFCSGGPLPIESAIELKQRLGGAPLEVFGSSETGGVAWRAQQSLKTDSQWQPFEAVSIRVTNAEGLLEIKSPFCYTDQWFVMGDKIDIGKNGGFYLKGRADRIVKIEEKRLSLSQMEKKLCESGWVDEVRVLPLSASRVVLAVVAVLSAKANAVLHSEGKRAVNEQIKHYLLQFFERVVLPRKFRYVDAMPINEQGKIVLADLTAMFDSIAQSTADAFSTSNAPQPPISIIEQQDDKLVMMIDLPAEHDVFEGHFPQWPILPGVVQLDIAARQSLHYFYPQCSFKCVERLKFQAVIQPGRDLQLTLHDLGAGKVSCCYSRAEKVLSSGTIVFGDDNAV